jgi:hypothetical protein
MDTIAGRPKLTPGTRVRLTGTPAGVTLVHPTGVIVRWGDWDDYYIVRLDVPAIYHNADGTQESLPEIRQSSDNLCVLQGEN